VFGLMLVLLGTDLVILAINGFGVVYGEDIEFARVEDCGPESRLFCAHVFANTPIHHEDSSIDGSVAMGLVSSCAFTC
jgi:hypothetical protein